MKTQTLVLMLQIAGLFHVGLLCAGVLMTRVANLREHLRKLPEFPRRLFWVYFTFIAFSLVSFGALSVAFAGPLAAGTGLARAVCAFLAVFWTIRLVAATFVFDVRPYLTNTFWWIGYHATNVAFVYLPVAYGLAAWKGGAQ